MLIDANTPSEYLDQLEDDWRRSKLLEIRDVIKAQAPELEESIHYKMLGYGIGDDYVFHLNTQRAYVSLYVGNISKIDPEGELVKGLNIGKGCIRFSKLVDVSSTRIDDFVARGFEIWQQGGDVDC
ncbi:MAG: DUF1801 domain-containing protein [Pseudomonadota bacterium]